MTSTIFLVFCPLVSRAEEQAGGGLAPGVIAAIAVGAVLGVVVAVGLVAYFQCGKKSKFDGNDSNGTGAVSGTWRGGSSDDIEMSTRDGHETQATKKKAPAAPPKQKKTAPAWLSEAGKKAWARAAKAPTAPPKKKKKAPAAPPKKKKKAPAPPNKKRG